MKVIEKEKDQIFNAFDPLQGRKLEIMDPDSEIINDQWMPDISDDKIVEACKNMLYARIVDLKAISFQRLGRLYTLPSNFGQEAAAVGSAMAINRDDWLVPAYRELGAWLTHGLTAQEYFLYVGGSEEGCRFRDDVQMAPFSVPISTQLTHAAGLGHAINNKNGNEVVMNYARLAQRGAKNPGDLITMGRVQIIQIRYKAAGKNFNRALEADPKNPEYNYYAGMNYIMLDSLQKARTYLNKAINYGLSGKLKSQAQNSLGRL